MKQNNISLTLIILLLLILGCVFTIQAQRISVDRQSFTVDGNPIFINGANLPWISWNDFGGGYNHFDWADEFAKFKAAKGNSLRIWITCSTTGAIRADNNGAIIPPQSEEDFYTLDVGTTDISINEYFCISDLRIIGLIKMM